MKVSKRKKLVRKKTRKRAKEQQGSFHTTEKKKTKELHTRRNYLIENT